MSERPDRKPSWLKVKLPKGQQFKEVSQLVKGKHLTTVCEEALCPNRGECWSNRTATFMIGGEFCTRACGFCATRTAKPHPLDPEEPQKVADAVAQMQLRHAVVTMVTRDDLADGASEHVAQTIRAIRAASPDCIIEVLTSDFNGKDDSLERVMRARPHVFNHNLETVERLTPIVRFRAQYRLSLSVLQRAKAMSPGMVVTKSGIMLGLGETRDELLASMDDLVAHGVTTLTLGQYLRPSPKHLPVIDYIRPEVFEELRDIALSRGFSHVASGPLIRSSHHDANFSPDPAIIAAIKADLEKTVQEDQT